MKVLKNVYDPNKPKVKLTKKDLKKTFEWFEKTKDIRRLAEMGWSLGSDGNYDENNEAFEKWENYKDLSDDELVSVFNEFKTISIFV